jgi:hypothetical protein
MRTSSTLLARGDPPTYKNVERWHRNLPALGKERNPALRDGISIYE